MHTDPVEERCPRRQLRFPERPSPPPKTGRLGPDACVGVPRRHAPRPGSSRSAKRRGKENLRESASPEWHALPLSAAYGPYLLRLVAPSRRELRVGSSQGFLGRLAERRSRPEKNPASPLFSARARRRTQ